MLRNYVFSPASNDETHDAKDRSLLELVERMWRTVRMNNRPRVSMIPSLKVVDAMTILVERTKDNFSIARLRTSITFSSVSRSNMKTFFLDLQKRN